MSDFHRSPSKVWWASDDPPSWNQRSSSSSPGSQDSGFSDVDAAESSPARKPQSSPQQRLKNDDNPNLSANIKDKPTPQKTEIPPDVYYLRTPVRRIEIQVKSEPTRKNCPKISRNLFRSIQQTECSDDQYADGVDDAAVNVIGSEVTFDGNVSRSSGGTRRRKIADLNSSAPAVLQLFNEAATSFSSLSPIESDSDSELECLFAASLESPRHTSTPKVEKKERGSTRRRAMNLLFKYQHERIPPTVIQNSDDGTAVKKWLQEARQYYEAECMTALQCKSIAAELAEKVSYLAAIATGSLRDLLNHSHLIQAEFDNLKNQKKHLQPLAQSLAGLVKEFVQKFTNDEEIKRKCEELRNAKPEEINKLVAELHINWRDYQQNLLTDEIKKLVDSLGDPVSEFDLRAKLTGLTSISLRNEELIQHFIRSGIVQILVVLCEKCEGSSVRALALRALSTICSNTSAIRQFEKASGVQVIADILVDDSRPEPERSEAVALLAQITAPWIEDNHNVRGLQEHILYLVKSLTSFAKSTRCCQNLLLCTAALANISAMDGKSIKYILHQNTVGILLEALKSRGPLTSVYLLEQVATLIANMSSLEYARKQLTDDKAPTALLCFLLQTNCTDESVIRRLQQKSIIALSRLCSEANASRQVVEMEGIEKLVKLCREKKRRYDSDAVLVATLATLRKIAEACGPSVISPQDAQELVEPRLLDSFLAYSTQNESLV